MQTEDRQEAPQGGLTIEDRSADAPTIEARVLDAIRSVRKGESRSLTTTNAEPIAPIEVATFLWDRLRPASIALASGVRVIPTDRQSITWPRLTADVDPTWVAETVQIPAGDPAFGTLEASPKKLAHRVELSNEVIDDSEPSIVDVLNVHLATMLALKLDRGIFEGNPAADAESIRGLKFVTGTQTIDMGAAGGALTDYDPILRAVGLLRAANVPGPYAMAMHPRSATSLALLRTATGSNEQLARPADLPALFTSSQLSTNEAKGTATTTSSAYVYAPSEVVLVRRQDAEVELDRSRLFDRDMSEMRAKLRADLVIPNPSAVVRIVGILPAA
jgi:HK97 family phage major capsid protein